MANSALLGNLVSAHDGFPATRIILGASTVKIDGRAVASEDDALEPHDKPKNSKPPRVIK